MPGRCAGRSRTFVEDPLSEELLKGEFDGKDMIKVDVKKVGDKKQLGVRPAGRAGEAEAAPEPVGAGAGTDGGPEALPGPSGS